MFHIFLSFLIMCAGTVIKCATSEKDQALELEEPITQPLPFASNNLFIFLDQNNEVGDKLGVIGFQLLTALNQKAGPILASGLLLRNIIKQPTPQQIVDKAKDAKDPNAELYQDLVTYRKEIHDYLSKIPSRPSEDEKDEIIEHIESLAGTRIMQKKQNLFPKDLIDAFEAQLYQFTPTPAEWVIKKVNDHLLLLVPRNYIDEIKRKNNFAQYYIGSGFTETELNLGVKLDHLENVNFDHFVDTYTPPAQRDPGAFFVDSLSTIFITRAEYAALAKQKPTSFHMPQWVFYLDGHGASGITIGNIAIDSFKKLLDFFDSKIVTKLLAYSSCYAAGVSAQNAYQDIKSPWFKTHSYSIATQALTDAPVTSSRLPNVIGISRDAIDFANKREKPVNLNRFDRFVQAVTKENMINFNNTLKFIFPTLGHNIFGSPQIKLPGVQWFNLAEVDNDIVSIGQVLATSRSANQPLDILKFFARDNAPTAILLYANIIPFELVMPISKVPIFISMIPGEAYHEFAKITIDATLNDFFEAMKPLKKIHYKKIFLIKKLKVTGTVQSGQGDTEFENVLVRPWFGLDIFVTNKEGKYFKWNIDKNTLEPESSDYSIYYQLGEKEETQVKKAREKMQAMEQIRQAQEKKIKEASAKK